MFIFTLLEYLTIVILASVLIDYVADYRSYMRYIRQASLSSLLNAPISLNICCFFNASIVFYMGLLSRNTNVCVFLLAYAFSVCAFVPIKYARLESIYVLKKKKIAVVDGIVRAVFHFLIFTACIADVCLYTTYVPLVPGMSNAGLAGILGVFAILPLFHKYFSLVLDKAILLLAVVTIGIVSVLTLKYGVFSHLLHEGISQDPKILKSCIKGVLVALASFEPFSFCILSTVDYVSKRAEKNPQLNVRAELAACSFVTGILNIVLAMLCGTITIYACSAGTTLFELARGAGLYHVIVGPIIIFALINQYSVFYLVSLMGTTRMQKIIISGSLAVFQSALIFMSLGQNLHIVDWSYAATNIAQILLTLALMIKHRTPVNKE